MNSTSLLLLVNTAFGFLKIFIAFSERCIIKLCRCIRDKVCGMGLGGVGNSLSSEGIPYLFISFKISILVLSKVTLEVQSLFNFTFS